jgi:hypothetical protein
MAGKKVSSGLNTILIVSVLGTLKTDDFALSHVAIYCRQKGLGAGE